MQFSLDKNIEMSKYGIEFLKNSRYWLALEGEKTEPDVQFIEGGYLFLASQSGADILRQNYLTQRTAGVKVDLMYPNELVRMFPWLNTEGLAVGTMGMQDEGWFDPWSFLTAMRRKVISLGAKFHEGEVVNISRNSAKRNIDWIEVSKLNSDICYQITPKYVINAAGAWAGNVARMAGIPDVPIRPRKRSIFVFHCNDQSIWKGETASPMVIDPSGMYFRREGSGGNFICGVSPPEDEDPDCFSVDDLNYPDHQLFDDIVWPALAHRVPAFESIKLISSWAGFYDYNSFDQNAIIGKHEDIDNLYLVNGFSGHGLQHAPAAGRAISELILDEKYSTIDLTKFGFDRIRRGERFMEKNIV